MRVSDSGNIHFNVYETEFGEEYVLVNVPNAVGEFVGNVRNACENSLTDIADKCFNTEHFKAQQAKRIVKLIYDKYSAKPEFLWEKYPAFAVFRIKENNKWFAVTGTLEKSKLGIPGDGVTEIMVLKSSPENVEKRVDGKRIFKAYHMNKKHWYTICMDETLEDGEIENLIDDSHKTVG